MSDPVCHQDSEEEGMKDTRRSTPKKDIKHAANPSSVRPTQNWSLAQLHGPCESSDSPPSILTADCSPCASKRVPERLRESKFRSTGPPARCWRFTHWVSCRQIRPEAVPLAMAAAKAMARNVSAAFHLPVFSGEACLSTDALPLVPGLVLVWPRRNRAEATYSDA